MVQADGIDQLLRQPPLRGEEPADERVIDAIRLHHRSEEHTSELQSHHELVCGLLLDKINRRRVLSGFPDHFRTSWSARSSRGKYYTLVYTTGPRSCEASLPCGS